MSDRGSTLPLILGFVVVGFACAAAAVAAGDAFVRQRDLQAVCDGAAVAAAAEAADLDRSATVGAGDRVRFAAVEAAVGRYLTVHVGPHEVDVRVVLSNDATTISLSCSETVPVPLGRAIGLSRGVRHVAHASAQADLS